jgi:F-type H+-transporting ATPase subunit gamma
VSDTTASLRRKIGSAKDLQSVVRTMKALAAASIGQYQKSVRSLADYNRTVEMGLHVCLSQRGSGSTQSFTPERKIGKTVAVVFGSDQGLVGQFNDVVADYAVTKMGPWLKQTQFLAVGERVRERLADCGVALAGVLRVPTSVKTITPLVSQILTQLDTYSPDEVVELYLFYNSPTPATVYGAVSKRLLPLDELWRRRILNLPWPSEVLPEVIGDLPTTLKALISAYLFVSIFRACAESLASENSSRLESMRRADQNIDELLEQLNSTFHRQRQSSIDEEMFDVISGFEALTEQKA